MKLDEKVNRQIEELKCKYDAENDYVPGSPVVSWTEMKLLQICKDQQEQINQLREEIKNLNEAMLSIWWK